MKFYRDNCDIPSEYRTEEYVFRPLTTKDVELDYEAVMESKEILRKISGSTWPSDNFTLNENYDDLERHERDHLDRKEFTFTIMNRDETICLGCIYFRPLRFQLATAGFQTSVRFWVRSSRIQDSLDSRVLESIIHWLKSEWKFDKIIFETGVKEERQSNLFRKIGMHPTFLDSSKTLDFQYFELPNKADSIDSSYQS